MKPRVLVACPIYGVMEYCWKEFIGAVKSIDYDNFDIFIVDNSKDMVFFEKLKNEEGIILVKDKTIAKRNLERLASSRNVILDYALEKNYDYVLMTDADVIIPKNALKDLLKSGKEIIGGVYFNYFKGRNTGKWVLRPVVWKPKNKNTSETRTLNKEEIESGLILRVSLVPNGCLLISKKAFKTLRYGLPKDEQGRLTGDDAGYFMQQAALNKIKCYCHTGIKCDHRVWGKFYKDSEGKLNNPIMD